MSYYIDIIDKESPDTKLDYRFASASGITLEWNGGDAKDEVLIVGTNLQYDILTTSAEDLAFVEFFTGNENRFLVQLRKSSDDSILWQGYNLPDQYSEPYKNGAFFVSFIASCGLGRLKGKYLPDEYYEREKSVIAILCQIIKMTNLGLEIFFAPAIENAVQKDWNQIVLDTADFKEKEKKKDAYAILETLLKDKQCVVYQADNRWYIEGLNQRHLKEVLYKKYTENGVYVADVVFNRLSKKITPLVEPTITIIPPYNEISVTHKKIEPAFPKTIAKEKNDGWAVVTGVKGRVYASDWIGHGGLYAMCVKPDYYTTVFNRGYFENDGSISYPQDDTRWVSLKEKMYFFKGQKIAIELEFKIVKFESVVNPDVNYELWKNPFKYEILFNNVILYTNFKTNVTESESVIFEESATVKLSFEHILTADSLMDVRLYAPFGSIITTKIIGIELRSASVSVIAFNEDETVIDLINDEFTLDKEIELTYADDRSGFSKAFRLAKLKEETTYSTDIEVPILYTVTLSGKFYSVVSLEGANLIEENKYQVYHLGNKISVNVIYNFNDGEQMVVETQSLSSGAFIVKKYAIDDYVDSRSGWVQWTDSVYKIENNSYAKTVANIYRRMFSIAVEKLDLTALNAVKFNDIIQFKYVSDKEFFPLNVVWNLDENKSELRLARSFYKDSGLNPGDDNVPPIVLAGEDIYISDAQTTANLLATAYDPDGFIVSQNWTKLVGGFGDVIVTPNQLATALQNLTEDLYTYKIEVADNNGATAFDTVNIIRLKDYVLNLNLIDSYEEENESFQVKENKYQLVVGPSFPASFVLNLRGFLKAVFVTNRWFASAYVIIEKNGVQLEEYFIDADYNVPVVLNYISTDLIYITMRVTANAGTSSGQETSFASVNLKLNFNTADFISGQGVVTNLPVEIEMTAQKSD